MKTQEMAELYSKRIDELLRKLQIAGYSHTDMIENAHLGALNILESLYGINSSQVREFREYKRGAQTQTTKLGYDHYYSLLGASIMGALTNAK